MFQKLWRLKHFGRVNAAAPPKFPKDGAAAPLIPPAQNHPTLPTEIGQLAKYFSPQLLRNIK